MARNHRYWTPEEDAILRDYGGNGCSFDAVAYVLGRTRCQVAGRAHRLGVRFSAQLSTQWTDHDNARLIAMASDGKSARDIGRELRRTKGAVMTHLYEMGLRLGALRRAS